MNDGLTEWERQILDNFHPDVLLGRRPFGKRVFVNDGPRPRQTNSPPTLVLIRGGKQA